MAATASHRRALLIGALVAYAGVFGSFLAFEVTGLGIGPFFYVPVVLVALVTGPLRGALAGAFATGLWAAAVVISPSIPSSDAFTTATAIRLVTFAGIGAVVGWYASTNLKLVERLTDSASRDFLTGLKNVRAFDEALAARCEAGGSFVLVLGDMDDLKWINDAHGHEEGNRAIHRVAATLTLNVAAGDEVARIGGDEFAILTAHAADEVRELTASLARALDREGLHTSFGWAAAPGDGAVSVELFRKADDRLYAAKLLRRNQQSTLRVAAQERVVY